MNQHPCEVSGIVLNLSSPPTLLEMERWRIRTSHKVTPVLDGRSWARIWGVHFLRGAFCTGRSWRNSWPSDFLPAGSVVKRTGWQRCPWWVGKCMGLWQLDERVYQHVILSFPSRSLPVHSIKLSSQPPIQAGDDEKNQRTITVNPAHMGKAFKVMNELRRYFSYFAHALLEGTCWVSVIRDWEQRSEHHQLVKSDSSSPTLVTWLSLSNSDRDRMASSNFSLSSVFI